MNTHYTHLEKLYTEHHIETVSAYIHKNRLELASDLSVNTEHAKLFHKITNDLGDCISPELLTNIKTVLMQAHLLTAAHDPDKLAQFLHVKSRPETVLMALEALKRKPDFAPIISEVAVTVFQLGSGDKVRTLFAEREMQLILLAHFINVNKVQLSTLHLSMEELYFIAPHLLYANCQHVPFKNGNDAATFISRCTNAVKLLISSDKIKVLKDLPKTLEALYCTGCHQLTEVNVSQLKELQTLNCTQCNHLKRINISDCQSLQALESYCSPKLETINTSNCTALKEINCYGCVELIELNSINCSALQKLNFNGCTKLKILDLSNHEKLLNVECYNCSSLSRVNVSNCVSLQEIECSNCSNLTVLNAFNCRSLEKITCPNCLKLRALTIAGAKALTTLTSFNCYNLNELNLFDCTALQTLDCHESSITTLNLTNFRALNTLRCYRCPQLTELNLSHCYAIEYLNCSECPQLEAIIGTALPSCTTFEQSFSLRLRQVPELPLSANVISFGSSAFASFSVDPEDLQTNPLQVLCHLSEPLFRNKRMPNIVFLNSPGFDVGGLRRQLVTTLMQNLFEKENSPLKLEAGEILNDQQILAFKTVGALIALSALTAMPLGRFLRRELFVALLFLEADDLKTFDATLESKIHSFIEIEATDPFPIAWMAKGFREIANPQKFRSSVNNFILRVEGAEVTWDNFNKLTTYNGDTYDQVKGYFKTFFERNPQKVNDMVELFTATPALGENNILITIDNNLNQTNLFDITTCFSQVKIPPYTTYTLFEEKLLKSIEYSLKDFGKA